MTDPKPMSRTGAIITAALAILILLLFNCEGGGEGKTVHFVEVADPFAVSDRYGDEELEDLLSELTRQSEETHFFIATHRDGDHIRISGDSWFWRRWSKLDAVQQQIRNAAAGSDVSQDYRGRLWRKAQQIREEIENATTVVRNSVIGDWSFLQECGRSPAVESDDEFAEARPLIEPQSFWGSVLGAWLRNFLMIGTGIVLSYGWWLLGQKVENG